MGRGINDRHSPVPHLIQSFEAAEPANQSSLLLHFFISKRKVSSSFVPHNPSKESHRYPGYVSKDNTPSLQRGELASGPSQGDPL